VNETMLLEKTQPPILSLPPSSLYLSIKKKKSKPPQKPGTPSPLCSLVQDHEEGRFLSRNWDSLTRASWHVPLQEILHKRTITNVNKLIQ